MANLKQQIADLLAETPTLNTLELAEKLAVAEGEIICALPENLVKVFDGSQAQILLEKISEWGEVVTIIEKENSIFEVKGEFPYGKNGYGYYNLNMGEKVQGSLFGHLKLDQISQIAFISKPFRGKESYAIAFIASNGQVIFKIYLGRDKDRNLLPHQVEKFKLFIQ